MVFKDCAGCDHKWPRRWYPMYGCFGICERIEKGDKMNTLKQIEWIYRVYKSIYNIIKIELKLIQLGTPFDSIILKEFVPQKANDLEILYGIYELIEKYKTDAIQMEITTIDCDLCNITIKLIKKKEGD